jgi:hypothetical protein
MAHTEKAEAVHVKKEKGDDVIADIIGDGNYEQDEDMTDANPNPIRIASPVSPTPLPYAISLPSSSPAFPPSLNVEPVSPPSKQTSPERSPEKGEKKRDKEEDKKEEKPKEKTKERPKEKTKEKQSEQATTIKEEVDGEQKHVPRIVKLSGDRHMEKSANIAGMFWSRGVEKGEGGKGNRGGA